MIHDLAESIVGDITPYCGISREEKLLREFTAMSEIADLLGPCKDKLLELFNVSYNDSYLYPRFKKKINLRFNVKNLIIFADCGYLFRLSCTA